jgi:hypothetical protein
MEFEEIVPNLQQNILFPVEIEYLLYSMVEEEFFVAPLEASKDSDYLEWNGYFYFQVEGPLVPKKNKKISNIDFFQETPNERYRLPLLFYYIH